MMTRKRMSSEERAEWEAQRGARLRRLREIEARLESELAAEKEAREQPPRRRRIFGFL
jgi:hypothetical protein